MKRKIAFWALAGFIVAAIWAVAAKAAGGWPQSSTIWLLVDVTCPIALLRQHPLSLDLVLVINAATYAVLGLSIQLIRRATASLTLGPTGNGP